MLKLFGGSQGESSRDALAQSMAEKCVPLLLKHLPAATANMSDAERRGYVRARAADMLLRVFFQDMNSQALGATETASLLDRVLDHVVTAVVRGHVAPIVPIPTPHVGERRAA